MPRQGPPKQPLLKWELHHPRCCFTVPQWSSTIFTAFLSSALTMKLNISDNQLELHTCDNCKELRPKCCCAVQAPAPSKAPAREAADITNIIQARAGAVTRANTLFLAGVGSRVDWLANLGSEGRRAGRFPVEQFTSDSFNQSAQGSNAWLGNPQAVRLLRSLMPAKCNAYSSVSPCACKPSQLVELIREVHISKHCQNKTSSGLI